MAIEWDENLRLGHAAIDIQHEEIFDQINNLSEKINDGATNIEIRNILNYLNTYAKKHFFDEEKLMDQYNYYGTYRQKKEHIQFRHEVDELAQMLRKKVPASEMALRIETALYRYFYDHVIGLDKELANFINFNDNADKADKAD